MVIQRIEAGNQGVLGGPVALAASQILDEQATVDVALETAIPDPAPEMSSGALDGATLPAQVEPAAKTGEATATLTEKNAEALEAARAVADKPAPKPKPKQVSASNYFIQPTSGRNWGVRHGNNAVDIANYCGNPVKSAADGTVVSAAAGGWNSGFGSFVLISHSNGTKTRYAHLSSVSVSKGQKVAQGQKIGAIGNTGKVVGKSGCHLHFEVLGGANPFVRS